MGISLLSVSNDYNNNREIHMDWWGTVTIVPGLSFITYALTDSAQAPNGWKSPQILVTFLLGLLCLAAGHYVENHVASSPLLPADLFAPRYMKRIVLALWLTYGAFRLYLFYSSFYIELVLQKSPIISNVYITTALPENYQGLAGALINSLLFLGISFWLGVSDIVVHQTTNLGLKRSYQMAFWSAVGAAGLALLLYCTIKIGLVKSDLTVQEKRQMDEANVEGLQQRSDSDQSKIV
ncbi:major facilitator superfamily transporter [Colletotrichum sojae]|uniref:Major facilitator superfamily transporter n=1 Tax=Colletotrichum sojae TaxID=2175907 RepID=A0A8H6IXY2_9PEZI|nr:major facilitator superfamily transporter [Colletotrichum sojae]